MIFYLRIKTDKELSHVPHIDSLNITVNGEEKHCTWDETIAGVEKDDVIYRFKGVSFNDEYANGIVKEDSVITIDQDFNWKEDDEAEEFEFEILHFEILDYDVEKRQDVCKIVETKMF